VPRNARANLSLPRLIAKETSLELILDIAVTTSCLTFFLSQWWFSALRDNANILFQLARQGELHSSKVQDLNEENYVHQHRRYIEKREVNPRINLGFFSRALAITPLLATKSEGRVFWWSITKWLTSFVPPLPPRWRRKFAGKCQKENRGLLGLSLRKAKGLFCRWKICLRPSTDEGG